MKAPVISGTLGALAFSLLAVVPVQAEDTETFENINPATGEVIDTVCAATEKQVGEAVQAAREAFPAWQMHLIIVKSSNHVPAWRVVSMPVYMFRAHCGCVATNKN